MKRSDIKVGAELYHATGAKWMDYSSFRQGKVTVVAIAAKDVATYSSRRQELVAIDPDHRNYSKAPVWVRDEDGGEWLATLSSLRGPYAETNTAREAHQARKQAEAVAAMDARDAAYERGQELAQRLRALLGRPNNAGVSSDYHGRVFLTGDAAAQVVFLLERPAVDLRESRGVQIGRDGGNTQINTF